MGIFYLNFVYGADVGVLKKIKNQVKAFHDNEIKCIKSTIKDGNFYFDNKKISTYSEGTDIKSKILRKIHKYIIYFRLQNKKLYKNIDIIYIRYDMSDPFLLGYLKFLRNNNKKIILEIPTYPYDNENNTKNLFTILDRITRKFLYKYIDKIVTFSNDKKIWGIECINIENGIDEEEIYEIKKVEHKGINFTVVANIKFWHGIDRFILAMADYYKNKERNFLINLHVVGNVNTVEGEKLKKIVFENNLNKYIFFHGIKLGKELYELYSITDICVGSLGLHRLRLDNVQPLKHREYCAIGKPFILENIDTTFKGKKYVYQVSASESNFDIRDILKWYNELSITSFEIKKDSINFSWKKQVQTILKCYCKD